MVFDYNSLVAMLPAFQTNQLWMHGTNHSEIGANSIMKTHRRVRVFGLLLVAGLILLPAKSQSLRQRQDGGNILLSSQMQSQSAGRTSQAGQRGDPSNRAVGQAPQVAADDSVPKDLRPLLTPRSSEVGRKHTIAYSLFRAHGFINAAFAAQTGFSEAD